MDSAPLQRPYVLEQDLWRLSDTRPNLKLRVNDVGMEVGDVEPGLGGLVLFRRDACRPVGLVHLLMLRTTLEQVFGWRRYFKPDSDGLGMQLDVGANIGSSASLFPRDISLAASNDRPSRLIAHSAQPLLSLHLLLGRALLHRSLLLLGLAFLNYVFERLIDLGACHVPVKIYVILSTSFRTYMYVSPYSSLYRYRAPLLVLVSS